MTDDEEIATTILGHVRQKGAEFHTQVFSWRAVRHFEDRAERLTSLVVRKHDRSLPAGVMTFHAFKDVAGVMTYSIWQTNGVSVEKVFPPESPAPPKFRLVAPAPGLPFGALVALESFTPIKGETVTAAIAPFDPNVIFSRETQSADHTSPPQEEREPK